MEYDQTPQTIGRALDEYEAALFVGRDEEIYTFRRWLGETASPILNVYGRGGVGKSTLLRAFTRTARAEGRQVLQVDADELEDSPDAVWQALAPGTDDPFTFVRDSGAVIFVDSYARLPWLPRFLQNEIIGPLAAEAKVVIAGRIPLGPTWRRWRSLMRTINLDGLNENEARRYLLRRGVTNKSALDGIIRATAGLPLALSLAADIVLELGAADLSTTKEWHRAVRSLVSQLMHELADPELARLLEASSVVHHFDEPTLAAITGTPDVSSGFARLCALSVVRAGEHGLTLHTDVRNAVVDDLRWRNPEAYTRMRERALEHLRRRMAAASRDERHWLSAERMFLWENAFVHSVLFQQSGGDVVVALGGPDDVDELLLAERRFQDEVLPQQSQVSWSDEYPPERSINWLRDALREDGARIVLARGVRGQLTGYSFSLPIAGSTIERLRADPIHEAVVSHAPDDMEIPDDPADATAYYLVRTCVLDEEPAATNAALFRDALGLLAREGVYLTVAALPLVRNVYETLRFAPIEGADHPSWLPDHPFQGYVLDLRRVGFEAWIDALMTEKAIVPRPRADELERMLAELLPDLDDDQRVSRSVLGQLMGDPIGVREMLRKTVTELRKTAPPDLELALHAVELAYLERAASHERLADRLSVSRSTFYRLLRRGIRAIAEALSRDSA